ncbi:n-acetylglutamate synthase [Maribacter sp. 2210JD10-5]|uniref:n-acetylglutamate synthase n=1 Tax=Maribacter sp. 2210JD10-5 TaxID=3386272 RepID=UPI0039BC8A7A
MNYNNRKFRPLKSSKNAETSEETIFCYKQENHIVTSEYSGGAIVKGHLMGTIDAEGVIEMCYHQINTAGDLMTGRCTSKPELMTNGKIKLHETWQWTSGDKSKGNSVLVEI